MTAHPLLQRPHAAVNAHDAEAVAARSCDDVIWQDPAAPATLHGRDAVLRFHRDVMFPALPDVQVELIDGPYLAADSVAVPQAGTLGDRVGLWMQHVAAFWARAQRRNERKLP
jgi:SnoaL-like domain